MHDFLNEGNFYVTIMSQILFFCQQVVSFKLKKRFGWCSAPDPAEGTYDALYTPLVGRGGEHPLPILPPSTPLASGSHHLRRFSSLRLRHIDLRIYVIFVSFIC